MKNTPLINFQSLQQPAMLELSKALNETWLRLSFDYALTHMAISGATKEELDGAKKFMDALQALGDKKEAAAPLPDKSRLPSFENLSLDEQKKLIKEQEAQQ